MDDRPRHTAAGRAGMLDTMWHKASEMLLERGEVEVVVAALRGVAERAADGHPRALMLAAVAAQLATLVDGPGVTVAAAPVGLVREAAQAYVRPRRHRVVRLTYGPSGTPKGIAAFAPLPDPV